MLFRLLFLVLICAVAYYLFNLIVGLVNANKCSYCDGYGYWQGTRGEKNFCKTCNGTGKAK